MSAVFGSDGKTALHWITTATNTSGTLTVPNCGAREEGAQFAVKAFLRSSSSIEIGCTGRCAVVKPRSRQHTWSLYPDNRQASKEEGDRDAGSYCDVCLHYPRI